MLKADTVTTRPIKRSCLAGIDLDLHDLAEPACQPMEYCLIIIIVKESNMIAKALNENNQNSTLQIS